MPIAGIRQRTAVSTVGVMPTLADLIGIHQPDWADEPSFRHLMDDVEDENKAVLSEYLVNNTAVITRDWHFIQFSDGTQELYNNIEDK